MRTSPRFSTERLARIALCGLLASGAISETATAATSAELRSRAQAVLADGRYQRELPAPDAPTRQGSGETTSRLPAEPGGGDLPADAVPETASLPSTEISTLAHVVLWLLLVAAVLLGLLWVVRERLERRRARPASPLVPPAERAVRETSLRTSPGDPTGLAAEGRYTEAAHALLLAAIALLTRRLRLPLPPSRTSRELLRSLPPEGAVREAFGGLVGTVERSWFGGAAIGPEEYAASVERFRVLEGRQGRAG